MQEKRNKPNYVISLKQDKVQNNILFFYLFIVCEILHTWAYCIDRLGKNMMHYLNLISK